MRAPADTTGGIWNSRCVQPDLLLTSTIPGWTQSTTNPARSQLNPLEWSSLWLSSTMRLGRRSRGMGRTPLPCAYGHKILNTTYDKSKTWMGGRACFQSETRAWDNFGFSSGLLFSLLQPRSWSYTGSEELIQKRRVHHLGLTEGAPTLRRRGECGYHRDLPHLWKEHKGILSLLDLNPGRGQCQLLFNIP